MIEVNRTLNVTYDELNQFIKDMVAQDVFNATGKKVKPEEIKRGYKYHKKLKNKFGKEGSVKTKIEELKSGTYSASFNSAQGMNYLSYDYVDNQDGTVDLRYEENYDPSSKSKGLNYQLMAMLYKRSNKKRINSMLNRIEYLIIENRKPV